jgi:GDP-L-fucose synthase
MKILVTGGSGLIGRNFQNICDKTHEYLFLNSKQCNLLDYQITYNTFSSFKPDIVIHLAAKVGGLYFNMENNISMIEDNLLMNINIMKVCRELKVKRFIGCLSTCIFPDKIEYPITEDKLHNGAPHTSNEGYAYAKRMLDVMCKQMNKLEGYNYVNIIPTNIYGKYDNFHMQNSHVIPNLIHKCYLAKQTKEPFVIKGSGIALRQFIYAEDIAKILKLYIDNNICENLICSSDIQDEISIKRIVEIICEIMKYNNVKYDTNYSDGQYKKSVDNSKLKKYLNFQFTNIEDGLKKTIEWVYKNYDNIRK